MYNTMRNKKKKWDVKTEIKIWEEMHINLLELWNFIVKTLYSLINSILFKK